MSVTVTVEATWRTSRIEFNTPFDGTGTVIGYGEMMLRSEDGTTNIGVMPSTNINRDLVAVADDTVEYIGAVISFKTVAEVLVLFMEKWRLEDAVPKPLMQPPPGDPPTQVPPVPDKLPPKYDDLPLPIEP
jgi:hypothetical protein